MKKICQKCKKEHDVSLFSKTRRSSDGYQARCKECVKLYHKEYYQKNKEKIIEKARGYYKDHKSEKQHYDASYYAEHKEKRKLNVKLWSEKNPAKAYAHTQKKRSRYPQKTRARGAVAAALRNGKIKKEPCLICNRPLSLSQAHHTNYEKPLDVVWLCPQCHTDIHKKRIQLPEVA